MTINREEMFAPIASVIGVGSYEEGLATVNETKFGLTSGIMTRSLARANHFRRNAQTGCVMVNLPTAGTVITSPLVAAVTPPMGRANRVNTRSSSIPRSRRLTLHKVSLNNANRWAPVQLVT